MPDSALVAATSNRLEPASQLDTARAPVRHTLQAAGVFIVAAAIGFGFDILQTPERFAAAAMIFGAELLVCSIASLMAVVAPHRVRVVLSLTGPLLPLTIGIYHALVGAPLESCTVALSLYLAGSVLLFAGPTVQSLIALGAAAGYACAASLTTATIPAAYSAAVLGGVAVCSVVASRSQDRRQSDARSQQEIYARMQATARLVNEAQSANHAKSELIAVLSHELRTPINVVMGYADLLIEGAFGKATPEQLDVLNRMRHQSAQLLDLVQPMLDLSRLEGRPTTSVVRQPFRIADLVESLQDTVPASWCKPGVSLSWQASLGPEIAMHSDRAKIEVVVRNLIHNALKYTDRGEVNVRLDSATTPGQLRVTVRDTGTGIAASDLPIVFEMFGQSNSDLPRDGGVGLGLYIVKRLTDILGGRVSVESRSGAGSTFTVILPLEAPATPM